MLELSANRLSSNSLKNCVSTAFRWNKFNRFRTAHRINTEIDEIQVFVCVNSRRWCEKTNWNSWWQFDALKDTWAQRKSQTSRPNCNSSIQNDTKRKTRFAENILSSLCVFYSILLLSVAVVFSLPFYCRLAFVQYAILHTELVHCSTRTVSDKGFSLWICSAFFERFSHWHWERARLHTTLHTFGFSVRVLFASRAHTHG